MRQFKMFGTHIYHRKFKDEDVNIYESYTMFMSTILIINWWFINRMFILTRIGKTTERQKFYKRMHSWAVRNHSGGGIARNKELATDGYYDRVPTVTRTREMVLEQLSELDLFSGDGVWSVEEYLNSERFVELNSELEELIRIIRKFGKSDDVDTMINGLDTTITFLKVRFGKVIDHNMDDKIVDKLNRVYRLVKAHFNGKSIGVYALVLAVGDLIEALYAISNELESNGKYKIGEEHIIMNYKELYIDLVELNFELKGVLNNETGI